MDMSCPKDKTPPHRRKQMLFYGIEAEKNAEQAVHYLHLADDQGEATAQGNLEYYYQNGIGADEKNEQFA